MGELIDLDGYKRRLEEEKAKKEEEERRLDDLEELEYMKGVVERIIQLLDMRDEDGSMVSQSFIFIPFPSGSQSEPEK